MQVINHRPILPTFALDSSPIHPCLVSCYRRNTGYRKTLAVGIAVHPLRAIAPTHSRKEAA
jgi:hypothetical protein